MRFKLFRHGAIRFLQVGRVTVTLAIAKPAKARRKLSRKAQNVVDRVREAYAPHIAAERKAREFRVRFAACLAIVAIGLVSGAALAALA